MEVAGRCPQHRRVLVIGASDCLDVPVAELAGVFAEVVLADIVVGAAVGQTVCEKGALRELGCQWCADGAREGACA